jgi:polyhydroxybutyrate depolymerase
VGAGGTAASAGTKGSGGVQEAGGTTLVGTGGSNSGGSKAAGGTSAGGTAGTGGGSENGGSTGGGGTTRTDGGRTDGGSGDSAAGGSGTGGNGSGGSETGGAAAGGSKTGGATGNGGRGGSSGSNGSGGTVTCPSSLLKAGDTNRAVQVGSDSRSYILHAPSGYDGSKPVPLVVDFHGLSGSGSQEEGTTLYKSLTDAEGVVSAYPNGMSGPMGAGWNVGPCCVANVDDVAFAKALVADAEKVACIDPKRVYAVGFSMGGGITHYLGCHAADVFAAVALAAFDLLKENVDGCKPSRPITVIAFRSHGDTFVNYDGGYSTYVSSMPITFLGAQTTFAKWAQIDQCTDSPSAEDSNGCSTYSSCGGGVQVTLCSKQGGTHEQGTASIGWPLLKKYTMP